MDDMTRFEQRMADDALRVAGPPRPVDVDAVLRGMPARRAGGRRLRPSLSVAMAVLAGVTAVLVGGYLLAGVFLQQSEPAVPGESATPAASVAPSASALSLEGFGQVTPVWQQYIVRGSHGGTDQIDWYEPEGVIDRHLYTATCVPTCDRRLLSKDEMSIFSEFDLYEESDPNPQRFHGTLYRLPPPPAEVQWLVELEYDPGHPGCVDLLDAEGRCIVDSGPWFWFSVPEGAEEVIPVWGEDITLRARCNANRLGACNYQALTTRIEWWEPFDVANRRLFYAACTPDCGGEVPTFDDMREYTQAPIDGPSPENGVVGTLFQAPEPSPAEIWEIWWMVSLEFDPDEYRCQDGGPCSAVAGPWRLRYVGDPPRRPSE